MMREEYTVRSSDVDMYRRLKSSSLLRMFQEVSISDTEKSGYGRESTLDKGALWALTRTSIKIERLPEYDEKIFIETHPGKTLKFIFPRYCSVHDKNDNTIVRATSLWVLMDEKSRKLLDPMKLGIIIDGDSQPGDLPIPNELNLEAHYKSGIRRVHFTDIDLNGHVNNAKYVDWAADLLSEEFHSQHIPSEIKIDFLSEVRPSTDVDITTKYENEELSFVGSFEKKHVFDIFIKYEDQK